jgi:hypothetical protein
MYEALKCLDAVTLYCVDVELSDEAAHGLMHPPQAGKEGTVFLLNRTQLSNPHQGTTDDSNVAQEIRPPEIPAPETAPDSGMYSTACV